MIQGIFELVDNGIPAHDNAWIATEPGSKWVFQLLLFHDIYRLFEPRILSAFLLNSISQNIKNIKTIKNTKSRKTIKSRKANPINKSQRTRRATENVPLPALLPASRIEERTPRPTARTTGRETRRNETGTTRRDGNGMATKRRPRDAIRTGKQKAGQRDDETNNAAERDDKREEVGHRSHFPNEK